MVKPQPIQLKIYVDGKKQESTFSYEIKENTIRTDKPFRIGRRYKSAQLNDTEIDDIRVYNRILPAGEIASVMELSYRFIELPKGLVSSIDFNQLEGKVFRDSKNQKRLTPFMEKPNKRNSEKLPLDSKSKILVFSNQNPQEF